MKKLHFFQFFRKIFQLYFHFFPVFTGNFPKSANRYLVARAICNLIAISDFPFSQIFPVKIDHFPIFPVFFRKTILNIPPRRAIHFS